MIGQTITHYKITEKIGAGGMGDVFKAEDKKLGRFVALKFLPYPLSHSEDEKKRFIHEAIAASALDHNNICTIYEINETDEQQIFIAMAFYEGDSLKELINKRKIKIEQSVDIAIQILAGLQAAHKKKIIHRDIKPDNILVTADGIVKIVDFGLAKLSGRTQLTKEVSTLGTVNYMSPEQVRSDELDQRTDLWSFGVVFYEMLSGQRPFRGDYDQAVVYSILNEDPQPLKQLNPQLPTRLTELTERCLEKDPQKRIHSAQQILEILKDYRSLSHGTVNKKIKMAEFLEKMKKPAVFLPVLAVFLFIVYFAVRFYNRQEKIDYAENILLPQAEKLVENNWRDFTEAYHLAEKVERMIPDHPRLKQLFVLCSFKIKATTEPPEAKVYIKDYQHPESEWQLIGISPIDSVRLPVGVLRWKFEKEDYEPVLAVSSTWDVDAGKGKIPYNIHRVLNRENEIPENMVRVDGAKTQSGEISYFFIDRFEVTNKQFKCFIDGGGYDKKEFWKHSFIKNGKTISLEQARAEFVDLTGRPGPANWQAGTYPPDQAEYPVCGVSWYEAAAYAEFCGKSLPTGKHWGIARGEMTPLIRWPQLGGYAVFAPFSNFGGEGLVQVGSLPGITAYGAFDMAGNVREWCWNDTESGKLIRGGAWNDNTYMFKALSQAPPMNRSEKNGFRCAVYPDLNSLPSAVFARESLPENRDFMKEKIVGDEIFKIYREQFAYDPGNLNSRLELRQDKAGSWIHETVSFNAAYGDERIIAHLFLPKHVRPPFQTVIYFPGTAALLQKSSEHLENYSEFRIFTEFLVYSGRAILFPVLQGTFERSAMKYFTLLKEGATHRHAEYRIQLVKDYKRCVDYLLTRKDIDSERLAYYGMSWGGIYGAIIPALEQRLKTAVILAGGLLCNRRPEVNQINYISRVKMPVLMINGKCATRIPVETSIKPMYRLLGTARKDKRLMLFDTDHIAPRIDIIRETLSWLDKYLGPVKRESGKEPQ